MANEFRLSKIGVIMLAVADLHQSVNFYRDQLGLELSGSTGEFAFFNAGGVTVALSTALPKALDGKSEAVEVVFSVDHVRVAHGELRDRGVHISHDPHPVTGENWAANFTDPDGHPLSVFGPQ